MEKIDYKKEFKRFYNASASKVEIVDVPEWNYLILDRQRNPNTSKLFQEALDVLCPASYALKIMIRRGVLDIDYGVLPLARFESFEEGKAAQTLHIGRFSEEEPAIERVHA